MPLQERFGARPIWACLVACSVHEITSFVVDSSRSRNSVVKLFVDIRLYLRNWILNQIGAQAVSPDFRQPDWLDWLACGD